MKKDVSIIGVDLAKQVFQLHGATGTGEVVFRKKLSRRQFEEFMKAQPRCRHGSLRDGASLGEAAFGAWP